MNVRQVSSQSILKTDNNIRNIMSTYVESRFEFKGKEKYGNSIKSKKVINKRLLEKDTRIVTIEDEKEFEKNKKMNNNLDEDDIKQSQVVIGNRVSIVHGAKTIFPYFEKQSLFAPKEKEQEVEKVFLKKARIGQEEKRHLSNYNINKLWSMKHLQLLNLEFYYGRFIYRKPSGFKRKYKEKNCKRAFSSKSC